MDIAPTHSPGNGSRNQHSHSSLNVEKEKYRPFYFLTLYNDIHENKNVHINIDFNSVLWAWFYK